MKPSDENDTTVLEGYQVVAINGKGVWITDEAGNCWHVGGPYPHASEDNKLVADYRDAVERNA